MGRERGQVTGELKRQGVALLAGSGRRWEQIAGALVSPAMMRNRGKRRGRRDAGSGVPPNPASAPLGFRIGRRRSPGFAARTIGCAGSTTV